MANTKPRHPAADTGTVAVDITGDNPPAAFGGVVDPAASGKANAEPASLDGGPAAGAAAFADGHVFPAADRLTLPGTLAGVPLMLSVIGRMTRDERRALLADIELREAHVLLAHPDLRAALEADTGSTSAGGYILILSATPGFRRAGLTHPTRAEYPLDFFTEQQLRQIRAEPQLQMVAIGGEPEPRPGAARTAPPAPRVDPVLAGRAAADAISRAPTPTEPGLRNAAAGDGFRGRVGTF